VTGIVNVPMVAGFQEENTTGNVIMELVVCIHVQMDVDVIHSEQNL